MSDDRSTSDGPRGAAITAVSPAPARILRYLAHRLAGDDEVLPVEGQLPSFDGATTWLNSKPLTPRGLRGRVVLVDSWTCSYINWLRTFPYLPANSFNLRLTMRTPGREAGR